MIRFGDMSLPLAISAWVLLFSSAFAKPAGHILYVNLLGNTAIKLRWIPPGHFTMGSPPAELGRGSNENQVSVELTRGYYLAETELTQAQWKLVIPENPSAFRADNLPVETITWADAKRLCDSLNQQQRKAGILPKGYRWDLPTECQWEYACRAGTAAALHNGIDLTSVDSKCDHLGQVAWYQENSSGHTSPVGTKKANRWGLLDMHGNVWEWCRDSYSECHPGGRDPLVTGGDIHIRRGGSATYQARTSRAASRDGLESTAKGNGLGMRLALVPADS